MHLNYHAYFKAIDLQRELLRDAAEELGHLPMRRPGVLEQPMTRGHRGGLHEAFRPDPTRIGVSGPLFPGLSSIALRPP